MPALTQNSQSVVNRDHDDVAIAGQHAAVYHVPSALHVGSAVDIDHDRLLTVLIMDVWKRKSSKETG